MPYRGRHRARFTPRPDVHNSADDGVSKLPPTTEAFFFVFLGEDDDEGGVGGREEGKGRAKEGERDGRAGRKDLAYRIVVGGEW